MLRGIVKHVKNGAEVSVPMIIFLAIVSIDITDSILIRLNVEIQPKSSPTREAFFIR